MRKITEYFRNALIASTQVNIDFKTHTFSTISYQNIEDGKVDSELVAFLWKNKEAAVKEPELEEKSKDVILAVKTIATEFFDQAYESNRLEEMTCIFFVPARVDIEGNLYCPKEGKWPWIPREFLDEMEDAQITIGHVENTDTYLENTTDVRNKIETWQDYLAYVKNMYNAVTGSEYEADFVICGSENVKTDGKCYIFADETVNAISNILRLYNFMLGAEENQLYKKMTNGQVEASKTLVSNSDIGKMKMHVGQMNGQYPLSPSQREAIHHISELKEGDVLAVSGPPGTGKTTLLQSVVASEYVSRALKEEDAPIIVAASTNNQAVTNIIDSFGKINPMGIGNLEKRWVDKLHSFATYFPATAKVKEAQERGYQYTDLNGNGIVEELEDEANRKKSKEMFLNEISIYFEEEFINLGQCKKRIVKELREMDANRCRCLSHVDQIKNLLGELTYKEYVDKLQEQIDSVENELKSNQEYIEKVKRENRALLDRKSEWQRSYDSLPWYVRWFRFLKCSRRRIETWSYDFMQDREHNFLKRGMENDEIQKAYNKLVDANDEVIRNFNNENERIQGVIDEIKNKRKHIEQMVSKLQNEWQVFEKYSIFKSPKVEEDIIEEFSVREINNALDKVRYIQFWLAVHYYECRWLSEERGLSDRQIGKTFKNVLDILYRRLAMLSPCMVMTFHNLPKQFCAYVDNEKMNVYMSNYIDLLIVDEAGQTSPEIALPAFFLAKKAIVVGDEQQIAPVWGVRRALDIALAKKHNVIQSKEEYKILEENGLNCSQSSVMKVAGLSCAFNKYKRGLFLSEHRRCYDEIIEYCNQLVYNGKLEPLRGKGTENADNPLRGILPVLGYKNISSTTSMRIGGSRCNREEAEQIALWLRDNFLNICSKYPKVESNMVIGVITPFKAQSSMIKAQFQKIIPEYAKNITVGTVHALQGGERQVIIFSSVYGKQDGCFFINRNTSLMNVAVSRAKDSFLVFGDRDCLVGGERAAAGLLKRMVNIEIDVSV